MKFNNRQTQNQVSSLTVYLICLRGHRITRLGLVRRVVCQQCRGWCANSVRWCLCSGYLYNLHIAILLYILRESVEII